jgi:hypothetical protein
MLKGVLEFVTTAANELLGDRQRQFVRVVDRITGFAGGLAINPHLSRHHGALGPLAALAKPAVHQSLINTDHGQRIASGEANASFLQ